MVGHIWPRFTQNIDKYPCLVVKWGMTLKKQIVLALAWLFVYMVVVAAVAVAVADTGAPRVAITVETEDESYKKELEEAILEEFVAGRLKLLRCAYFEREYPHAFAELKALGEISIVATPGDRSAFLGFGYRETSAILLLGPAATHPDVRFETLAHELLHVVGMPKHKPYKSRDDYYLNDPIEQVMYWCVKELQPGVWGTY